MEPIRVGKKYRFDYPKEFVTLPDYTAHRGQTVTVLRPLVEGKEYDLEVTPMYRIQAADEWQGDAWEEELTDLD